MHPPSAPVLPRRLLHRRVLVLAGIYNIAWGLYSALDPQWLFRVARMPALNHPESFACLAPERGWLLAAVGLIGKVVGPLGLAMLIATGRCPGRRSCFA